MAAGAQYAAGDAGPAVAAIQTSLKDAGYFGGQVDGKFTAMTRQAVLKFQKDSGLKADGIVEEKTYKALTGKAIPPKAAVAAKKPATGGAPEKILSTALAYRGVKYQFGGDHAVWF